MFINSLTKCTYFSVYISDTLKKQIDCDSHTATLSYLLHSYPWKPPKRAFKFSNADDMEKLEGSPVDPSRGLI